MKELEKKLAKYFRLLAYVAIGLGVIVALIVGGSNQTPIGASIVVVLFVGGFASLKALSMSGLGKD